MNRTITDITKFICCVGVFLNHFFLRSPFVSFLGPTACAIFFMLSAYGICLSLDRKPMGFTRFMLKRVLKIYIPLLMVNVLAISLTSSLCSRNLAIPTFGIYGDRLNFLENISCVQVIYYIIGIYKIDEVTWFLDVLFASYIFIWLFKQIKNNRLRVLMCVCTYFAYVFISFRITPPASFGHILDPLGVVVGVVLAEMPSVFNYLKAKVNNSLSFIFGGLTIGLGLLLGCLQFLQGRYIKLIFALIVILGMLMVIGISSNSHARLNKFAVWLGGTSYFVYLVHVKIMNLFFVFYGEKSMILSLLGIGLTSAVLYWFYQKILYYIK